jgi:signal transduction histidine kinase
MMPLNPLYQIELFEGVSDEEMAWIIANSREVWLQEGEFIFYENEPADSFYIVLEGELQVTRTVNGKQMVMGTTPRGIMGGEISLLNDIPSVVNSCAIMPTRLMVFDADTFRQLVGSCPIVGKRILRTAAERMAGTMTMYAQQQKMAALGKLSAGLAHEMNNPASAARRSARTLIELLPDLQTQTLKLSALNLSDIQLRSLIAFQSDAVKAAGESSPLSPLERSDREDTLADWLDALGVPKSWELAPTFVSAGVTIDELQALTAAAIGDHAVTLIIWLECALKAGSLLWEIEQSTERISNLVGAVKEYTYMDKSPVQDVDVHRGLENTLRVLGHKLRNVEVIREYDLSLPIITARGGELNQVWTNLIDNAIDAAGDGGTIWLITRHENAFVMVEVADNGSGIPAEVMPQIFEPFFTTKEVGKGTGLGLDITYRIVEQHGGTIDVQSLPGRTRFIVRLPIQHTAKL